MGLQSEGWTDISQYQILWEHLMGILEYFFQPYASTS